MNSLPIDNLKGILTILKQPITGTKEEMVKRIKTTICKDKLISPLEAKEEFLYFTVPDEKELKGKRAVKYNNEKKMWYVKNTAANKKTYAKFLL